MILRSTLKVVYLSIVLLAFSLSVSAQEPGKKVSLKEMIGEMIMIGFRGVDIHDEPHLLRDIKDYHLGGVIIYEYDVPSKSRPRNIVSSTKLKNLIHDIQEATEKPMFIAIDEEGGRVSRLRPAYGFTPTLSAMHYGSLNNADSTYAWADTIATRCRQMGVNMNFSPVVDLCLNPQGPVIAALQRCFSANPEIVVKHAGIVMEAHRKYQIVNALKHFPGHGSAGSDTHEDFTDVTDVWQSIELEPYRQLIKSGDIDMIMTAHVFNRNWDEKYPASLSKAVLTGLLRNELNFEGVIITDDLHMGAISDHYTFEETVLQSILAGADILMFSNNSPAPYNPEIVPQVFELIEQLIKSGKITEKRIQESYLRITQLKEKL